MSFKVIILMLLIVLFTIFVVQNTEPVSMQAFFWRIEELPKIILLIVTLVLGIIMGIFISTFINRKKKVKDVDKKEIMEVKKENVFPSGKV
jgi:uncharacterized integral membrane protein